MPLGKYKVYVIGFSGETTDAINLGHHIAKKEGLELVFEYAKLLETVNFARAKAIWVMPYGEIDEERLMEIIRAAQGHGTPIEYFRSGDHVGLSDLFGDNKKKREEANAILAKRAEEEEG